MTSQAPTATTHSHEHMRPADFARHLRESDDHKIDRAYDSLTAVGVDVDEEHLLDWAYGYCLGAQISVDDDFTVDDVVDVALHDYDHRLTGTGN